MRDTKGGRDTGRGRSRLPAGEPDVGLLRARGSRPELKAAAPPMSPQVPANPDYLHSTSEEIKIQGRLSIFAASSS